MLRKMACVFFLLFFSGHSFAKGFDCNSQEVFNALTKFIRENALHIGNGVNRDVIKKFPINYEGFPNVPQKIGFSCAFRIKITAGEDLLKFIKAYSHEYDQATSRIYEQSTMYSLIQDMSGDYVLINSFYANFIITDDHKDVIVDMQVSHLDNVINALAWFEMNEVRLTDGLPELRYENAKSKYDYLNGELNLQWGNLSSNVRQKMKKDALKWITFKNKQCGDIKLIQSDTLSLQEKTKIYDCHSSSTEYRLDELGFTYHNKWDGIGG
ncbi:TPA: DUF1311 domain-containing protein [Enterobacter chuandaensis]|uniref:hypothetical protein n=1 Tax=Enterobacterales TaxID=91347 RepID=UPI0032AF702B|nr:DUF1311 domain-containing protein [Enterobacter chuandaensis]